MAGETRGPTAARWVAVGFGAFLTAAAAVVVLLLATSDRADAALLPEPVSEVVAAGEPEDVTGGAVPGMPASVDQTVTPVLDPVVQTVTPITDPVVQSAAPVLDPALETVTPILEPVVQSAAPVLDAVVTPTVGPLLDPALGIPLPSGVTSPAEPHGSSSPASGFSAPSSRGGAPPDGGVPGPAVPTVTASERTTGANTTQGVVRSAAPGAPVERPLAPEPVPEPLRVPPTHAATSSTTDTTRTLQLLLFAVAVTLAALTLPRGRRVLPFGAVKPRLAFVSSIERPG